MLVAIVLALVVPAAHADVSEDLDAGFQNYCGYSPTQACALDYWGQETQSFTALASEYQTTANTEGFAYWCLLFQPECATFWSTYYSYEAAADYSVSQWIAWGGDP